MEKQINMEVTGLGGITAKVIADSVHPAKYGKRLTTIQLRYPRFIHSEVMTHRVFSRNASSSRAIPVAKMIAQVREDAAMPIHWGRNQSGMKARDELNGYDREHCETAWRMAARQAADIAESMHIMGLHKQVANRILEPFQFISVIVTATEWGNFFELRNHPDAQPEINELAKVMLKALNASVPKQLGYGDWHLPYVSDEEFSLHGIELCRKLSAARCARVSYLTHDGAKPDIKKDEQLFNDLVGSVPLHASPIEHQATPDESLVYSPDINGNFRNWIQFRKVYESVIFNKGRQKVLLDSAATSN